MTLNSRIFIMRHGEGDHNKESFISSNPNSPHYKISHLTDKGINQVKESAIRLKKHAPKIGQIFVSPLPRTIETVEQVIKVLDLKHRPIIDNKLIEVDMGIYEGRSIYDFPKDDWWDLSSNHDYGGETEEDIAERLKLFIKERNILTMIDQKENDILIITHGSPIKMFLDLFGYPKEKVEVAGFRILTSSPP